MPPPCARLLIHPKTSAHQKNNENERKIAWFVSISIEVSTNDTSAPIPCGTIEWLPSGATFSPANLARVAFRQSRGGGGARPHISALLTASALAALAAALLPFDSRHRPVQIQAARKRKFAGAEKRGAPQRTSPRTPASCGPDKPLNSHMPDTHYSFSARLLIIISTLKEVAFSNVFHLILLVKKT